MSVSLFNKNNYYWHKIRKLKRYFILTYNEFYEYYMFSSRSISKPLQYTIAMLKDIAEGEGNLTSRISVENKDEIGKFSTWFNSFIQKLQDIITKIAKNAVLLNASSGQLSEYAKQMIDNMEQLTTNSSDVSSATEALQFMMFFDLR